MTTHTEEITGSKKGYIVVMEWNGLPPPTKWYRRLYQIAGLRVRGKLSTSLNQAIAGGVLAARVASEGVIVQEGAIYCMSYSLARTLAVMLREGIAVDSKDEQGQPTVVVYKPAAVILGEMEELELQVTEADAAAIAKIHRRFSKKGRRPTSSPWVVTCIEECESHSIEDSAPVVCPHCMAAQIRLRPGEKTPYTDPGGDVFEAWQRTRFATGAWEVPDIVAGGGKDAPALGDLKLTADYEQRTVEAMRGAPLLGQIDLTNTDREMVFRLLDAVFAARTYWSPERRMRVRAEAVAAYFQRMTVPVLDGISIAELPQPDLFDLAPRFGKDYAAAMMQIWQNARSGQAVQTVAVPAAASVSHLGQ